LAARVAGAAAVAAPAEVPAARRVADRTPLWTARVSLAGQELVAAPVEVVGRAAPAGRAVPRAGVAPMDRAAAADGSEVDGSSRSCVKWSGLMSSDPDQLRSMNDRETKGDT